LALTSHEHLAHNHVFHFVWRNACALQRCGNGETAKVCSRK
jgi:hypothetical protein